MSDLLKPFKAELIWRRMGYRGKWIGDLRIHQWLLQSTGRRHSHGWIKPCRLSNGSGLTALDGSDRTGPDVGFDIGLATESFRRPSTIPFAGYS